MANSNNDLFDQGEDINSSWFKFEAPGNSIIGTLVDKFHKEGEGDFQDQEVYVLKNAIVNGEEQPADDAWNVGIKVSNNYVNSRVSKLPFNSNIGFKYDKDIPPTVKGHRPAKSIQVKRFDKPLHSNPISAKVTPDTVDSVFDEPKKDPSDMPF